mgnify:FL=1
MQILYPLIDPITEAQIELLSLEFVSLTLAINYRKQHPLVLRPTEAQEILLALCDKIPVITFSHSGKPVWNMSYTKPQFIDGRGNLIDRKDLDL